MGETQPGEREARGDEDRAGGQRTSLPRPHLTTNSKYFSKCLVSSCPELPGSLASVQEISVTVWRSRSADDQRLSGPAGGGDSVSASGSKFSRRLMAASSESWTQWTAAAVSTLDSPAASMDKWQH